MQPHLRLSQKLTFNKVPLSCIEGDLTTLNKVRMSFYEDSSGGKAKE